MAQAKMEKKDKINKAAIAVISREGFYAATTDKIAAEAAVAVGTIYNYFKSKEDILLNIFKTENERRNSFFRIISQMELEPMDKIRSVSDMLFAGVASSPELFQILISERSSYLRIAGENRGSENGLLFFILTVLEKGIDSGSIRDCDTAVAAVAITGAIETVINTCLDDRNMDAEASKEELLALIGEGILKQGIS